MRESSHSFPGLNRACVVISSQLYDRRAIDSPLPTLPLLTSLQHLAYLTSTSPRIREILTIDGGLERLISIVGGCLDQAMPCSSSSEQNPRKRKRQRRPFKPFSAYALASPDGWVDTPALLHTYGFALQCLVNVGVRGSEEIRTRVVEAGVLAVVARILSAFLANRHQERERRLALLEPQKSITLWREGTSNQDRAGEHMHTHTLAGRRAARHALQQQQQGNSTAVLPAVAAPHSAPAASSSFHQRVTPPPPSMSMQSHMHTHIPAQPPTLPPSAARMPSRLLLPSSSASSSAASLLLPLGTMVGRTDTPDTVVDDADAEESSASGQEYETDSAGAGGGQMDVEDDHPGSTRSRRGTITSATFVDVVAQQQHAREIVVKLEDVAEARERDDPQTPNTAAGTGTDAAEGETPLARSVSLQPTTAIVVALHHEDGDGDTVMRNQRTSATPLPAGQQQQHPNLAQLHLASFAGSPVPAPRAPILPDTSHSLRRQAPAAAVTAALPPPSTHLLKEDDVLHCLHLLAYLSKYPHVRAVFHDPENETVRPPDVHPCDTAAAPAAGARAQEGPSRKKQRCCNTAECEQGAGCPQQNSSQDENMDDEAAAPTAGPSSHRPSRRHAHANARSAREPAAGSDEEDDEDDDHDHDHLASAEHGHGYARLQAEAEAAHLRALASIPLKDRKPALEPSRPPRSTANNVFSLVEQFTYRPSGPADRAMRLPTDIQYWAGVIMRNACRKDEAHGGIRQCANMGCGVWEKFPREFAKCRRCRKAKYCSKGCQRRAWQAGHRYWCSARQDTPPPAPGGADGHQDPQIEGQMQAENVDVQIANLGGGGGAGVGVAGGEAGPVVAGALDRL